MPDGAENAKNNLEQKNANFLKSSMPKSRRDTEKRSPSSERNVLLSCTTLMSDDLSKTRLDSAWCNPTWFRPLWLCNVWTFWPACLPVQLGLISYHADTTPSWSPTPSWSWARHVVWYPTTLTPHLPGHRHGMSSVIGHYLCFIDICAQQIYQKSVDLTTVLQGTFVCAIELSHRVVFHNK